jgi:hypothetical protein
MKYGYEQINYTNFENDLYDARFELAASRIMDTDLETIEDTIIEECEKVAVNGKCSLGQLKSILRNHKSLCLTPFQLALLCGLAKIDKATGMLDYNSFAANISHWITEMFSIDAMRRKAQLVQLGHFKVSNVIMPKYNENLLFSIFRQCDRDSNGFLEWNEYQACLLQI